MLEPVGAPSMEYATAEVPGPELRASLAPFSVSAASYHVSPPLPGSVQTSETAPASPHSFGGGLGIRLRDGKSALDLMGQYKYHVNSKLDIGGMADWALSPINSLVIAPAAWWNVNESLTLFGAPGIEIVSSNSKGLLRFGGSFQVPLGDLAILPFAWYDMVSDRDNALTFGVAMMF